MTHFKVGDWVVNHVCPYSVNEPFQITKIDEQGLTVYGSIFIPNGKFKHWQPKVGEWCWFIDNGVPKEYIQLRQFESMDGMFFKPYGALRGYANCEPFIGELPSFLKDK